MKKIVCLLGLWILAGCWRVSSPLPEGPPIPKEPKFEGKIFVDRNYGFSFRYYPAYKEIHRDEKGVILSKDPSRRLHIVVLSWPFDENTYRWYLDAFSDPKTLRRRLKRELKISGKVLSYRILNKKGADTFLFTVVRPSGLYNQRIEIFPKENPRQISFLFQHEEVDLKEVLNMIGTIKILEE
jgi:hypothetical protein